jgi:hypothetical protein
MRLTPVHWKILPSNARGKRSSLFFRDNAGEKKSFIQHWKQDVTSQIKRKPIIWIMGEQTDTSLGQLSQVILKREVSLYC